MLETMNDCLVTFSIFTGSGSKGAVLKEISNTIAVMDITINHEINKIPTAHLKILDGNVADADFHVSNTAIFSLGNRIKINLGYDNRNDSIFEGIIIISSHKIAGKCTELSLTCKHDSFKMTLVKGTRQFNDIRDYEVVEELLNRYGIATQLPRFGNLHSQLLQTYVSDWDFMLSRIDSNGYGIRAIDRILEIFKPNPTAEAKTNLTFGRDIYEFSTQSDIRSQAKSVKASSWDYSNQNMNVVEAEPFPDAAPGNVPESDMAAASGQEIHIKTSANINIDLLQSLVNAKKAKQSLSKIKGNIKFQGTSKIRPGDWINLQGLGQQFNGKAFVSAIQHEYQDGNWLCEATLGWEESFYTEKYNGENGSSPSGQFSSKLGLQIGIVTDIIDPLGQGRVKIKFPMIDENGNGIYARLATLDAGSNRGTFFRPEINDEVVVDFLNDDPAHPVILGMLHSSVKPPPFQPESSNPKKGYVSRSQLKITIDDIEKSVEISTPGGRVITLNDSGNNISIQDMTGNKIVMGITGITLHSPTNVSITAGAAISLSAPQLSMAATAGPTSKGAGGIDLKSNGTTRLQGTTVDIKGQIVKIN